MPHRFGDGGMALLFSLLRLRGGFASFPYYLLLDLFPLHTPLLKEAIHS